MSPRTGRADVSPVNLSLSPRVDTMARAQFMTVFSGVKMKFSSWVEDVRAPMRSSPTAMK